MCGFVGFKGNLTVDAKEVMIKKMVDTIVHRGPDSDGIFADESVALGFRRLSIIDLSDVASQPVYNETGDIAMVFNGEIYNYLELREQLVEAGHQFKSHSDSEVLVHGYEEYGVALLSKLRGMFAFSIWDKKKNVLFIARDFFGIKPLYYTKNTEDGALLFGSEIKSFLAYDGFNKELNEKALRPYLTFQYSSMTETFFKGVYKLPPAHYMWIEGDDIKIERYWHTEFNNAKGSVEENIAAIEKIMAESVDYHKHSDVKVGSFLSGGIDSSYITALLMPDKTFSVGFEEYEAIFNETHHAKALSEMLGIENHTKIITADECFDKISTIQYHMDEPQSNPSSVPLYFLAELAREHVTVVLSGEGADEIFGGYPWYQSTPFIEAYDKFPLGFRRSMAKLASKMPKNRLSKFLVREGMTLEEKYIGAARVFTEDDAVNVLKPKYKDGPTVQSITSEVYKKVAGQDDVSKMQYLDLNLWLPGDILLKADKMSMAHSLELRVPFLDKEVMAFASHLPSDQRVSHSETKIALRKAALNKLPEEWAKRPKLGFPVPIRYWMREEKYYKQIKAMFEADFAKEFFDTDKLLEYLEEHYQKRGNRARYIWTVYVFLVWYEAYFIKR